MPRELVLVWNSLGKVDESEVESKISLIDSVICTQKYDIREMQQSLQLSKMPLP
jgi:uncharacterized protein (DUF305 family)